MREVVISERAEADLREIWLYSFDNWGDAQADRYLDELDGGLQQCGVEPERGKDRESVRPGYWSRRARKHVVFYTFSDTVVLIQRVLHGSMDPSRHV